MNIREAIAELESRIADLQEKKASLLKSIGAKVLGDEEALKALGIQPLTGRQKLVLRFIKDYLEEHGYPPTLREMGRHMEIKSTNGITDHLRALERKGYIRVTPNASRGLKILFYPEGEG